MATYNGSDRRLAYLFQNGGGGSGSCKVISGYYHDGDFYEDQSYTQIITGDTGCLYIDLDTTTLYLFDGTNYEEVQGGGGGSSTLAGLSDVSLSSLTNGQVLKYDANAQEWVNANEGGGGAVGDGTVGTRIEVTLYHSSSVTFTFAELGITKYGSYWIFVNSKHAESGSSGWKWIGFAQYSGYYTSSYQTSYVTQMYASKVTVTMNEQAETITFANTNGTWDVAHLIEVLPLHPKVEVEQRVVSGYYNNGNFYEDSALTTLITGNTNCLYIDLFTTKLYLFDGTNYIVAQGGGGEDHSYIRPYTIENVLIVNTYVTEVDE